MPELLLELFSEEIPARMQARGAEDLARLTAEALAPLAPAAIRTFHGPRRIALAAEVAPGVAETRQSERGPRISAPEQALAGFLRKHGALPEMLREEGGFWVLERAVPGTDAATLIARAMPGVLRRFPWPKSMRWGGTSQFTWVRPLRRILCILAGATVPFDLRQGDDDGHGLASGDLTEGHRFMSPGAFRVTSAAQWQAELRARHVVVDAGERRRMVADGVAAMAAEHGATVVEDAGLLDEVTGLVEWPVPLAGRIDAAYMDLPPEVMQVSMRVNQRYFALRDASGNAAPHFAFAANIAAGDDGRAIIAGNERVLRARFSDARHFWDLDRKRTLESRLPDLDNIIFHAKLGSVGDRVRRLEHLAREIASSDGREGELLNQAARAARLCKADLTTGMVGEFPELQGVIGYYYTECVEEEEVRNAIRDHYRPRGSDDALPRETLSLILALADRIDLLVSFFSIGERPTGSGDPFALRRAAIGVVRILRDGAFQVGLRAVLRFAGAGAMLDELFKFIAEDRWRAQMRAEGLRYDVVAAILGLGDDNIRRCSRRALVLAQTLDSPEGQATLRGYKRASNILRDENAKDGPHLGRVFDGEKDLTATAERVLWTELKKRKPLIDMGLADHDIRTGYSKAVDELAKLGPPLDAFFDAVVVNSSEASLRRNRLGLLASIVETMNEVADFSKIEG